MHCRHTLPLSSNIKNLKRVPTSLQTMSAHSQFRTNTRNLIRYKYMIRSENLYCVCFFINTDRRDLIDTNYSRSLNTYSIDIRTKSLTRRPREGHRDPQRGQCWCAQQHTAPLRERQAWQQQGRQPQARQQTDRPTCF